VRTSRTAASGSARRARPVKVVVTGPFGAGKTTLISSISDIPVLATDQEISDDTRALKQRTTVAMDFGRLTVDPELVLYLFGTPGQRRFEFMWEILAEGMLGFIVLVDQSRPETLEEARHILAFFREQASVPFVVGVNKVGADDPVAEVRTLLDLAEPVRVAAVDARDRESVKARLVELLLAVLADIDAVEGAAV
jgi:uncharacterized protein